MRSEKPKAHNNINWRVAAGALTVAAMVGPGAAGAAAAQHNKHPRNHNAARIEQLALKRAEQVTEKRMLTNKSVAFLRGDVVIQERVKDRIDPQITHGFSINIKNPLLVYLPEPNAQHGFKDIEASGECAVGFMDQTGDQPKVTFVKYNQNQMSFIAEEGNTGPNIQYAFFQQDKIGGLNLQQPLDSFDGQPHGGPLTDPAGNPEPIGLAYEPMK